MSRSASPDLRFDLVRPCKDCPFRTDCLKGWLGRSRAASIAYEIGVEQRTFSCHETTEAGGAPEGAPQQHCAGALLVLEAEGASPQLARIAERLGMFDPSRLDRDAPTFERLHDFVDHHANDRDPEEGEPCGVADFGCLAPAGYAVGGGAVENVVEPGLTEECDGGCGNYVCENCAPEGTCPYCLEREE